MLVVGASVGLAAVLGTLRFLYGWSLKPLIFASLVPVLSLTVAGATNPDIAQVMGLAWDTGAVTTGPVTVPLMLALGIGIAAAAGERRFRIIGIRHRDARIVVSGDCGAAARPLRRRYFRCGGIVAAAAQMATGVDAAQTAWYERSPGLDVVMGIRAIVPLVLFLLLILRVVLREKLARPAEIYLGITLAVAGMCLFNIGLTYGLSKLGGAAGALAPAAFMPLSEAVGSPLYAYPVGLILAILFAWVLGFGATIAEPALSALGATAEQLTNGFFRKRTLIMAVSVGVAFGIAAGITKLVFDLPFAWLIVPPYLVAAVLTAVSSEEFVNVAWDSAGVTTGPITVPLVLAMGLGFGNATHAIEGFGILALASIGPIISVLLAGVWARVKAQREARAAASAPTTTRLEEVLADGEHHHVH